MLVEIEGHTVPHFKALVYAKVELWGLECGGIFSIQTSLLDISHLLHKTGFVKTESVGTVPLLTKLDCVILCLDNYNAMTSKRFKRLGTERISDKSYVV